MFEGRAEESLATQATEVFNSVFFRIGDKLGEFPSNTIVAVLYTEKQFRDITRAPEWSGGQYDGRIRIPAAGASLKPELFERVLTHELTHAVVAGIAAHLAQRGVGADLRRFRSASRSAAHEGLGSIGSLEEARERLRALERVRRADRVRRKLVGSGRDVRPSRVWLDAVAAQARRRSIV
jgi:hypothetical protein